MTQNQPYIGRLAPSPTGLLHIGHIATFHTAHSRARQANGKILLRNEDIDYTRCKPHFTQAFQDDLQWMNLHWDSPVIHQSERLNLYLNAWKQLRDLGLIYPCHRSRREIANKNDGEEPLFPKQWRGNPEDAQKYTSPGNVNWRFITPENTPISFIDNNLGEKSFTSGVDFGDFLIWRKDGMPSYELAVVVDDIDMNITEVVRGADLLKSTSRQILLYQAFKKRIPEFYHCPLLCDDSGQRLAKRFDSLSIQELRNSGLTPQDVWKMIDTTTTKV